MTDWNPRTNGTLRGFLVIVLVAAAITAAGQVGDVGLGILFVILRIAFLVVIAVVLFRLWRRHREEIAAWPARARVVLYGAAALAFVDVAAAFLLPWPSGGLEALVFFFVLAASGFAIWRVWQDEHTYGY